MTHPPEPIPDLDEGRIGQHRCPECGGPVDPDYATKVWRCDHCRITWTPDGTGGQQT